MTSSIIFGVAFVLLAAAEIGAAYHLRVSKHRAGSKLTLGAIADIGLTIGAVVTLIRGALLLIQHAKLDVSIKIVVVAQIIAVLSLIKLIRNRASEPSSDAPRQFGRPAGPPPGTYGTPRQGTHPPEAPRAPWRQD